MVTGSEVVPENRGNRGGAGAGRKETALSPGSARRGARRTSGARNSSYGVGRSRDPVGGRGCATPALLGSLPGCRSCPSGATSTSRVRQFCHRSDQIAKRLRRVDRRATIDGPWESQSSTAWRRAARPGCTPHGTKRARRWTGSRARCTSPSPPGRRPRGGSRRRIPR